MYGVVEISGHQYRVSPGDLIDVEKLDAKEGTDIEFDQVFFIGGDKPAVGLPVVDGAKVKARVIKHDRSKKQIIFKRKPGKYRKKNGHRQQYTALLITGIEGAGQKEELAKDHRWAEKFLK